MINSINFVRPSYPVKFKGNEDVRSFDGEKQGMKTSTKLAIGTGLAALASVGIYLATKGKIKKNFRTKITGKSISFGYGFI